MSANQKTQPIQGEFVVKDEQSLAPMNRPPTVEDLMAKAIERGDTETMEKLFSMRREMRTESAEMAFNAAMSKAQREMRQVGADAVNPQTHSAYATYSALDKMLRPIYTANGFALSFNTADSPLPDSVRVLCEVSHEAGFSKSYKIDMPADGKGAKGGDVMTKTHATGAAASYGMRYLLKMIWNVAIGEDDTDGNMPEETITEREAADLSALIQEVSADKAKFLAFLKVKEIKDIPAARYKAAVRSLEVKRRAVEKKEGK